MEKTVVKPILKWAGGKTQMLNHILPVVPNEYGKYIEPFVGGGALFFALQPEHAIISDSNPELINTYIQVANAVEEVIECLKKYENTKEMFYAVRAQDWTALSGVEAAARMIYLNKTCFNGLYRVNKIGQFNVPFGNYKNPKICDEEGLRAAAKVLRKAKILCGDYKVILEQHAAAGDFIFLDPPYLPISTNADFKRYTKEQFYKEDHVELAEQVERLHTLGCYMILTNSNHPFVHALYAHYPIEVYRTRRCISVSVFNRLGEDVVVTVAPEQDEPVLLKTPLSEQTEKYPPTRFMGSKSKLLSHIWSVAERFRFQTVVDLFSGSGIVGYMFKAQGKTVICNDYMSMSATFSKALVENNTTILQPEEARELLKPAEKNDRFVEGMFRGLYFTDEENILIDNLRNNIKTLQNEYKRAIAMTALIRACMKKRPRGIFTYVGNRYDDGRRDLKKSFEQQFFEAVEAVNAAVFDNGKENQSICGDAMQLCVEQPDLVYIDPPYYSPFSDNEYVRRYHFVEGLARDWNGVEIQWYTRTKKFQSYPTPFSKLNSAVSAFDQLFQKYKKSILIVSYSSNSLPTQEEIVAIMSKYKKNVDVVPINYQYSFGNQSENAANKNKVQEFLFVGY